MRGGLVDEGSEERRRASRRRPLPSTLLVSLPIILSCIKTGKNDHLRLAFGCEGGGGGGRRVERMKETTSGSCLDAREVVVVGDRSKRRNDHLLLAVGREGGGGGGRRVEKMKKNHLLLAVGRKGGGGGGSHVKMTKRTTSSSRLDVREVVVVGVTLK
jgi:hypothetical protein